MTEVIDIALLFGRIAFGGFFLLAGINHFAKLDMMAQYAGAMGVPAPKVAVAASGVLLLIGATSIILGVYPQVGLLAIAAFLVGVTPTMHAFWKVSDPQARTGDMVHFQKNLALLGAALALLAVGTPWAFALGT